MPWDNQNGNGNQRNNPWGRNPRSTPSFDDFLREYKEKFGKWLPNGGTNGFVLILIGLLIIWGLSGFYRVQADEQGVVLRFNKLHTPSSPGLKYHMPWPIESVLTPRVTIVNRVDIGMRGMSDNFLGQTSAVRDVPEESLMLTGDENIVDVDFSVFWLINDAAAFLFNIQNPEGTVKAVAESTMREIVGQSDIQPILTEQRQKTEAQVRAFMQKTHNKYGAGITRTQFQLKKVDPPAAVIDAFRDVQAARADQERARNEANAYANRVVPEAQGEAVRIRREAEAYREQTVAESEGQASRFAAVYNAYRNAPNVTRQRLFLETIERVMQNADKVVIDPSSTQGGVVPYLPLDQLRKRETQE